MFRRMLQGDGKDAIDELVATTLAYLRAQPTARPTPGSQAFLDTLGARLNDKVRKLPAEQLAEYDRRLTLARAEPQLVKLVDGALLSDDFQDDLDRRRWRIWSQAEGVTVRCGGGQLEVSGRVKPGPRLAQGFTGVVSKTFRELDVVLRAQMAFLRHPWDAAEPWVGMVHLCATSPDSYTEACYGKFEGERPEWHVNDRSGQLYSDRRGSGFAGKLGEWGDVRIAYDAATRTSGTALRLGGPDAPWRDFARSKPMPFHSVKIELKTQVGVVDGEVAFAFKNCRLFRRAKSATVDVAVFGLFGTDVAITGVTVAAEILGQTSPAIAAAAVDELGRARLAFPEEIDYPAQARIKVIRGERELLALETAPVAGVDGVYPGDLWAMYLGRAMK